MSELAEPHDERRLQVQTYHEWLRAANGKSFPTLAEMEAVQHPTLGESSFVLDLTDDILAPTFLYIGDELLVDCEDAGAIQQLKDVPAKTLISRLSEHYLQCISNRAPVGFEAAFENCKGEYVNYRGIVLPLSSDDQTIDHIWGTVNGSSCTTEEISKGPDLSSGAEEVAECDDLISALSGERKELIDRVGSKLDSLLEIEGVSFAALIDRESRAPFATSGNLDAADVQALSAGSAKTLSEQQSVVDSLTLSDERIEAMQFSFSERAHLIQPISDQSGKGLFVLLVMNGATDDVAMAQFKVRKFEKEMSKSN